MSFTEKYTTTSLISADKDGVESKKISISEESFLQAQLIEELTKQVWRMARHG